MEVITMIIQIVTFESAMSEEEVLKTAKERAEQFRAVPGLRQKFYAKTGQPGQYAGIYHWDSMQAMAAYRDSDLAASIPQAYGVKAPPKIEIFETSFSLYD